jgi:hypothetical protein
MGRILILADRYHTFQAMEQYFRPYKESEKADLRSRKYSLWQHIEHFGMKWIFILLILLAPFLAFERFVTSVPPETEGPLTIVLVIISIVATFYMMKRMGELDWNKIIEQELHTGQVEVIKIATDRVIKRKDPEDFGSGYYLKIDKDQTLYLEGQYLDELQYSRKFPNTEFEIIRTKWNNELLEINSHGKYLKPERKLKPFTKEQYKTGDRPFDGDIINLPIDEII